MTRQSHISLLDHKVGGYLPFITVIHFDSLLIHCNSYKNAPTYFYSNKSRQRRASPLDQHSLIFCNSQHKKIYTLTEYVRDVPALGGAKNSYLLNKLELRAAVHARCWKIVCFPSARLGCASACHCYASQILWSVSNFMVSLFWT